MTNLLDQRVTRRSLGKGAAGLALAGGLATRGGWSRSAAAQDEAVYTLMDPNFISVGGGAATEIYNQEHADQPPVQLEEVTEGWDSKVLPQIRDDNLRWSGTGYIPYFEAYKHVRAGIISPLEEYLAASPFAWAQEQADIYFTPRVYESLRYEDTQYYVPMKANVHMAGWRQDYLEAAGYDALPATWDEVDAMLPKIKEALAAEEVIPFAIQRDLWRAIGSTFATFIETPLDEQGVFKIESPEWFDMIGLFKKWIDEGNARFDANDIATDSWQKGGYAMSVTSHSWVRLGRQVWGPEAVRGGVPPQANAEAPKRTWAHIDFAGVFNAAPQPQVAADWMLAIYGPEGAPADAWWSGTLTFSGSPVHQAMIEKYVTTNTELAEVGEVLALLPDSAIPSIAQANGFNICQLILPEYLDRYFNGEDSAEGAMASLRTAIDEELAAQQS